MDELKIKIESHEQRLLTLEKDVLEMHELQKELRSMNETLVILATELKHTNLHLTKQEEKIREIEMQPRKRLQQIATAIISALAGGIITTLLSVVLRI